MAKKLNVFKGKKSIEKFLNPGEHPMMPLVELPESLNPFAGKRVRIFAKLMTFSPLGNVKSVPAFNMMQALYQRGELDQVENVIENSSGNTVFSLALAALQFGVKNTSSYVPHEISIHKLWMLLFFGVQPIVNKEPSLPDANDPRAGVYKAREKGAQPGWINPGQYNNPDNPAAHEKWTAKQIWKQTKGKINILCAGLGTTGTITGTAKTLKKKNDAINIVGVMREDSSYVPGVRTKGLLELIGFDWEKQVDFIEQVTTEESYSKSMQLSRQGIVVGPSSGFALCGLLNFLQKKVDDDSLEDLRNDDIEITCVFICPDSPVPYLDEYFKYLDTSEFPEIINSDLLENEE
ncbi:MAG: pyridoxal-phosphate dependent enzyme [Gammaproteobacteria bacterium]|jgi:cysteine synthase|nr:pyridoxal-phosphate dependent enzyme [Gammaproteobacteria bacterium]MBT3723400.1 pyridoxal-phosphate dependent enzyme [Gammaproteobacteria bacterium]MBT4077641.1 pyridoxal-phosphate dependent enzyme [Gammaproteobacteria bacterium]MBT4196354.1 pyridoxal-phosphate dependent enzyme [Gammaproteobacteria bacterium]MBT4452384.1 pyridoxal-phosphate dependent enzyme [Gammaproteobacteria bacterium]